MEIAQGLLAQGVTAVPAAPEATAEDRARRRVGMEAVLASLNLALPPAALEAELEARIDASFSPGVCFFLLGTRAATEPSLPL